MIELIVSVCLIDEPNRCKDVRLNFLAESVTLHQCVMFGQVEIAKWSEGHPKWQVAKWRCRPAETVAKI